MFQAWSLISTSPLSAGPAVRLHLGGRLVLANGKTHSPLSDTLQSCTVVRTVSAAAFLPPPPCRASSPDAQHQPSFSLR
jgi:hypothetical protein